jgi:hypothetical protein
MKTSSAKAKGRNLQRWVVERILNTFPELHEADVSSRSMGAQGEDVLISPRARQLFPYSVECKAHNAFSVYGYLEQAQQNCPQGVEPLLVIKGNHKKPLVIVDADYFFKLIKE